LSLKLHIEESPKKLEFKYDKSLFELNKTEITTTTKGKHTLPDYLTIKCIKTFNNDRFIDVYADNKLAGRIKVHKNGKGYRRKVNIVLAPIKTNITGKGEEGNITGEEDKLKKYLSQALITPNITIDNSIDLSKDTIFMNNFIKNKKIIYGRDSKDQGILHTYMMNNYNLHGKYPEAFVIYIFDLACPGIIYRENKDNKPVWYLSWDTKEHDKYGNQIIQDVELDGKTGEVLKETTHTFGEYIPEEYKDKSDRVKKNNQETSGVYKTYKGKSYTQKEWEEFEQKLFEEYVGKHNISLTKND
jgi:hypothetical protein